MNFTVLLDKFLYYPVHTSICLHKFINLCKIQLNYA